MARGGITKSNMLLLRSCRVAKRAERERGFSKFSGTGTAQHAAAESPVVSKSRGKMEDSTCWVPHPRTGIYFPKGHEWVMDDVPEGAACFGQTHWFRNVDGVDNHNHDAPQHSH